MSEVITIFSILNSMMAFGFGIATILVSLSYKKKKYKLDKEILELNKAKYRFDVDLKSLNFNTKENPEFMKKMGEIILSVYESVEDSPNKLDEFKKCSNKMFEYLEKMRKEYYEGLK